MNQSLDERITDVLHDMSRDLSPMPNVADVSRRAEQRRRRNVVRRIGVGVGTAAVTIGVLTALIVSGPDPVSPAAPDSSAPSCEPPATLPFTVVDPPPGWQINTTLNESVAVVPWWGGGGVIEIWNGIREDLPTPVNTRQITVLGRPATIGTISDGFSVVFDLGPTVCDRWAVVAHPSVSMEVLEQMSQLLTFV